MRFILLVVAFGCLTIPVCAQKKQSDKNPAAFDSYIKTALGIWKTPGMSVVVVKDGRVVFQHAYGVRNMHHPEPYTTQTLSTCASTTKAMTAVCMGILVDQGKLNWTDKVIKYLPEFRIGDPLVTAELTVQDLFTHNAGLGNADNLWVWGYDRSEILRRMQFIPPAYSLRGGFIYQNIMYIAAGELIKAVSGQTWDQFITTHIFTALGMTNTFADHSAIPAGADQTTAHYPDKDSIKTIPYLYTDNIGAAGGVWSCSEDMGKWLLCLLDSTKFNGGRLLKPATYAAMLTPHSIAPLSMYPALDIEKPHWFTYGLGWFQRDYRGEMLQFHTGSLAGLTAIAALIPEKKFGVYVFGNLDHAELRHAMMYRAIDNWVFGDTPRDWSQELYTHYKQLSDEEDKKEDEELAKRISGTQPGFALDAATGKYTSALYGDITISQQNGSLQVAAPHDIKLVLSHWHNNVFRGDYNNWWYGHPWVQFLTDMQSKPKSVTIGGIQYNKQETQ
ncbi:MAG: serine hydrolase [Bacteroidota bacterium]|nr:serine hydrolase [Bacteroidota bacterium]